MKILVVEDDPGIAEMLQTGLREARFEIDLAADGPTGLQMAQERTYGLIILDIMLPGMDGWRVCRSLREARNTAPILMLTARDTVEDRVRGLEGGADDYLPKPFDFKELLARVRALLRRAKPQALSAVLQAGDIELDRDTRRVHRAGRELHLGSTEFRLLEFLMRTPGRVFNREQLLDGVWGHGVYVDERTVDVHVGRLRKALNRGRGEDPIRTVRGAGYALDDQFARET